MYQEIEQVFKDTSDDFYAEAILYLSRNYPSASWGIRKFPDYKGREHIPYLKTETGYFVEAFVEINGIVREVVAPVLDDKGDVVFDGATALQIQVAHELAILHCIAMHNLDVPQPTQQPAEQQEPAISTPSTGHGQPKTMPLHQPTQQGHGKPEPPKPQRTGGVQKGDPTFLHEVDIMDLSNTSLYRLMLRRGSQVAEFYAPIELGEAIDVAMNGQNPINYESDMAFHEELGEYRLIQTLKLA